MGRCRIKQDHDKRMSFFIPFKYDVLQGPFLYHLTLWLLYLYHLRVLKILICSLCAFDDVEKYPMVDANENRISLAETDTSSE